MLARGPTDFIDPEPHRFQRLKTRTFPRHDWTTRASAQFLLDEKFLLANAMVMPTQLFTNHTCVRYTPIGTLLIRPRELG